MIPPSIELDNAAQRDWDAVVIGAGPAGALVARQIALSGAAVLLADKKWFPREKVCGCCLNLRALAALDSAGLAGLAAGAGAVPLNAVQLFGHSRTTRAALPGGIALSRERFDADLVAAATRAGAAFLPGTRAALGTVSAEWRTVNLKSAYSPRAGCESSRVTQREAEVRCRLVLIADGLGSRLLGATDAFSAEPAPGARIGVGASACEAPAAYAAGCIYLACGRSGYAGLVRLEDGRLNLAAAVDAAFVRKMGGPGAAVAQILEESGAPAVPGAMALDWRGTPPLTRKASRVSAWRALVLGDAAGYIEPFTGEGMAWALTGALAAAPIAVRGMQRYDISIELEWRRCYRRTVARRQALCRAVAWLLRRPALTRIAAPMLTRWPRLTAPVVRHLNGTPPPVQG